MRKIILRTVSNELEATFDCPAIGDMQPEFLPEIVTWNGRFYVFGTLDDSAITYHLAFNFALVQGVTAFKLSDADQDAFILKHAGSMLYATESFPASPPENG